MTKNNKKLIIAIAIALSAATAAGAGIHLIAGEGANTLGRDSAKEIALNHAGLAEAEVTIGKIELDRDDRRTEYEVVFRKDGVKYEYEIDAESGEIIAFDKDEKRATVTDADGAPVAVTPITADEAKAAALAHAGLNEADVTFTKVKLDRDDNSDEYEIEFRKDNMKYEYDVDAKSGEILSYDKEIVKNAVKPQTTPKPHLPETDASPARTSEPEAVTDQPAAEPAVSKVETTAAPAPQTDPVSVPVAPPEAPKAELIGDGNAKAIALAHAGLSEADVTFTKVKLDRDDGRIEYEIEFRQGRYEYEYDIDAESGDILDFEKEIDD